MKIRFSHQLVATLLCGVFLALLAQPGGYRCVMSNPDSLSRLQCLIGNAVTPNTSWSFSGRAASQSYSPVAMNDFREFLEDSGYDDLTAAAASAYDLDPNLVRAMIMVESGFRPYATSPKGAGGLMQLTYETARSLGVSNRYNPHQNVHAGARYLRTLLDQFNGNKVLALAAYNAGPGNVRRYGGVPPFRETQNYVRKVLNLYRSMNDHGIV